MENLTFVETLLVAVVGMLVVFMGLIILIALIKLMGVLTGNMGKKEPAKAAPAAAAPAAAPAAAVASVVAPLINAQTEIKPAKVDDQTVAVLTAAIAAVRGEGYPFTIKRIVRVKKA